MMEKNIALPLFAITLNAMSDDFSNVKRSTIAAVMEATKIPVKILHSDIISADNKIRHGYYNLSFLKQYLSGEETTSNTAPTAVPVLENVSSAAEVVDIHSVTPRNSSSVTKTKNPIPSSSTMPKLSGVLAEVPKADDWFVPWGVNYKDLKKIIKSSEFFPVYISGLSGTGKSVQIKNICAELSRKYVRVQFSAETAEDDLIGGFRLIAGETVWADGPVVTAMKEGAILLLDEFDRSSMAGALALQGVLEGEPILIKKTGEIVHPQPGFNIVATGNSKGRGDLTGKYNAASIIDDATLERFVVDIEQFFPDEENLLSMFDTYIVKNPNLFTKNPQKISEFAKDLAAWGKIINDSFTNEAIDETISVRRLIHTLRTFGIFGNANKAIQMTTNRFDEIHRDAFADLFKKVTKVVEGTEDDGRKDNEDTEN